MWIWSHTERTGWRSKKLISEGDGEAHYAYYCLHKFHWKPTVLLTLSREEKAFILACIQLKADAEKAQEKKMKVKKPRKR